MQIIEYKYIKGSKKHDGVVTIPELCRNKPATPQFIQLLNLDITLKKPTAFIYVEGFSTAQCESGLVNFGIHNAAPVRFGTAYIAHTWAKTFKNKDYLVSIESTYGSCAAGAEAVYKAFWMIGTGLVDEVIVIGGERITDPTKQTFKQLGIDVLLGDGIVYMRFGKGDQITHPVWKFHYNDNPFVFTKQALNTLFPPIKPDYVKLHATGTQANEEAEEALASMAKPLRYKDKIGHTQGISALLETCIVLDDPEITGSIRVVANGIGGHMGAFTVWKQ